MNDAAQYKMFHAQLTALIDPSVDSLRFYHLGNKPKHKVEHIGAKVVSLPDDVLMV